MDEVNFSGEGGKLGLLRSSGPYVMKEEEEEARLCVKSDPLILRP